MKYSKELHDELNRHTHLTETMRCLLDEIDRLNAEVDALQDAWFIDEEIQEDGSLRPRIGATVFRLQGMIDALLDEIDRLNAERSNLVADIVLSQDTETPMAITDILNRLDGDPPAPESEGE